MTLEELLRQPDAVGRVSDQEVSTLLTEIAGRQSQLAAVQLALAARRPAPEPVTEPDKLLTVPRVADRLGMKTGFVYELIRTHQLPAVKLGRRYVRVRSKDLEQWVSEGGGLQPTGRRRAKAGHARN